MLVIHNKIQTKDKKIQIIFITKNKLDSSNESINFENKLKNKTYQIINFLVQLNEKTDEISFTLLLFCFYLNETQF